MALFQPTNVIPSTFNGTGTVDATQNIAVSWQVNGNSPMVAYRIVIMQNDTESTEMLSTGKLTLVTPFYGTNYKGDAVPFRMNIPVSRIAEAGIVNGYEKGYKMVITQWWGATDDTSVTQSSASYFITRALPTVTMGVIPTQFTFLRHTFTAAYAQAEGDAIQWARWELERDMGAFEKVADTGKIYGTAELKFEYVSFLPSSKYRIKCTIETENGVEADTGWTEFNTWRNDLDNIAPIVACPLCDRDAVRVGVHGNAYMYGTPVGTYSYVSNVFGHTGVNLPQGSSVTWCGPINQSLLIPPIYSIAVSFMGAEGAFLRFQCDNDSIEIAYTDNSLLEIKRAGELIFSHEMAVPEGATVNLVLRNRKVNIYTYFNGVSTYVEEDIYAWERETIDAIIASGECTINYIYAEHRDMDDFIAESIAKDTSHYPGMNDDTMFIVVPDGTLRTGEQNIDHLDAINNFGVFRQKKGHPEIQHVIDYPMGFNDLYDYGAASQNTYQYTIYPTYPNEASDYNLASYTQSREVTPVWWNYTVLTAYKDSAGYYHVIDEYRFALDVGSGNVGNNNTPTMWQNFTRYPVRQRVSSNYRSGTLTAFIGKVENDRYIDSVDLMWELYGLSTNGLTKFLKTRKGDLMMIETSAPIAQQIGDKFAEQPAKISLPWVEVGSTEEISVVGNAMLMDAPFLYVDLADGNLKMLYYPEYVDSGAFELNGGSLYLIDPGIYDEKDYSMGTDKNLTLKVAE